MNKEELEQKIRELKKKQREEAEIKELKQELWKLEHKKIRKAGNFVGNFFKGIGKMANKGIKKVNSAGNNYEQSFKNNKELKKEDDVDIVNIIE